MSERIRQHIRSNVVGYMAFFVALSGTAYAVDGPLPGQDQVGSGDIIDTEVKAPDIGKDAVRSDEVQDEALTGADIDLGAISSSEVLNSSLTTFDLGTDSVSYSEIDPDAFTSEIAETSPGFVFGIANDSIQSNEVTNESLTGSDINESTLGPNLDIVHNASSDEDFGPTIGTNVTNIITDNLNAGTWVVFAKVTVENHGDDNTLVLCSIRTDGTRREEVTKHLEAFLDDSGWDDNLPLTAVFTTSSPTTLRLACQHSLGTTDVRTRSADLVAIPVSSVG
jgi:hypothetical protein